jgi:hypothetical protein
MDPGALALPFLNGSDGLARIGAERAKLVQLRIDTGGDGATVGQVHWRLRQQGPLQPFPQILQQVETCGTRQPARGG